MKKQLGKLAMTAFLLGGMNSAMAEAPVKACFVYVSPASSDAGYSTQHNKGRLEMEKALAGKVVTSYVENVSEGPDAERIIREMATSGCKAIFGTSFGYMNQMEKVAKNFPNTAFFHATGYKSNPKNFANYNARFYEGRYVSGVIAGKMTKSNILGYVAAFPIPEVLQGINAFTLGAKSVNPKAKVRVVWVNSWYDPGKEREASLTLINNGADVLTHHTDSTAVVQAAGEKNVLSIGYHSDMSKYAPKHQVSAVIHEWGKYYTDVMNEVISGNWKPKNVWYGYAQGMIHTAPLSDSAPADLRNIVNKLETDMKAGTFHPFKGPIKDQSGKVRIADGVVADDATLNKMDYFVEGVDSQLPKK